MVTDQDIARWRLRTQLLTARHAATADEVVGHLLAVQAENPSQAGWAVAARTSEPDGADLARLLDEGRVIRTHVLRPTWHYVRAEDTRWLLELTAPRIRPTAVRQLEHDHGLEGREVDRLSSVLLDSLAGAADQTRAGLAAALDQAGIDVPGPVLTLLLGLLELDGLVCSGRPDDGAHTYALAADRLPVARPRDRDEALAEVALRYVTGHGPATEKDLAYWATLTLTDVRRGISQVRGELDCFDHGGRTFWHAAGCEPPGGPAEPAGHLLQILDETYRGYQDSRMVLDAAGVVPPGRETAIGMALVDGQMVARMTRTLGRRAVFTLTPYGATLTRRQLQALEAAAERYGAFLGLEPEVVVV
ncbi:winged helix DNA-binding domain-containing protein [Nocardioides sp. SYSU DS0663]|uniref:winged helix DNA-binding domain-containing protein n=1 Tax=Nocardioides sp. SYSU DS0663 TaxID=3416445 RepID=UPI003F4AFED2